MRGDSFRRAAVLAVCLLGAASSATAQGKTDIVVLDNGDSLTCEINELVRGKLSVDTDSMGTVQIEWDDVQEITSPTRFEVELETGERFIGALEATSTAERVTVVGVDTRTDLNHQSIVRITELAESFWSQIDGSMDVGFNLTKANDLRQWSFTGDASRRTERHETRVNLSSLFTAQEDLDNTSRHTLAIQESWFLPDRWILAGVAQFQQNEELDLELRSILGGGLGRYLVQTNRTILSALGGIVANRERFAGEATATNAEALALIQFQRFTFDDPETDISVTFSVLPNLSDPGRVRLELDTRVRREILKDFYFNISFFDSYDSDPPPAAAGNDYGLISSFGWSF